MGRARAFSRQNYQSVNGSPQTLYLVLNGNFNAEKLPQRPRRALRQTQGHFRKDRGEHPEKHRAEYRRKKKLRKDRGSLTQGFKATNKMKSFAISECAGVYVFFFCPFTAHSWTAMYLRTKSKFRRLKLGSRWAIDVLHVESPKREKMKIFQESLKAQTKTAPISTWLRHRITWPQLDKP